MMEFGYLALGIFVMFLATYLPRALPLALVMRPIRSPFLLAFFRHVPYAVLTALTIPAIFTATASPVGAAAGFLAAAVLTLRKKSMITVALFSAGCVYLFEGILMPLL